MIANRKHRIGAIALLEGDHFIGECFDDLIGFGNSRLTRFNNTGCQRRVMTWKDPIAHNVE